MESKESLNKRKIEHLVLPSKLIKVLSDVAKKINILPDSSLDKIAILKNTELTEEELTGFTIFLLYKEIDEVIENLNIVLDDLYFLPDRLNLLIGSPRKRLYLLKRTYFYEFSRTRDIFNQTLHGFKSQEHLKKEQVSLLKNRFYKAHEEMISIRNILVHKSVVWNSEEDYILTLVDFSMKNNMLFKKDGTGEALDLKEVLNQHCQRVIPIFQYEGMKMRNMIQNFIDEIYK
ncbi:hypothetical protein VH441_05005 [Psychrobacter sp. HD31]|uniref:hypothetical protein n=1 Tax=Psychrobacter sp. HD31 TaxID=3112003 RepID=UPI003DA4A319